MKQKGNFDKFIQKKRNSAVKEGYKKEKKEWKKERAAAIDKKFEKKRIAKSGSPNPEANSIANVPIVGEIPLNKFIAHSGICSRRDAAELVKSGKVLVNGKVVTGTRIQSKTWRRC